MADVRSRRVWLNVVPRRWRWAVPPPHTKAIKRPSFCKLVAMLEMQRHDRPWEIKYPAPWGNRGVAHPWNWNRTYSRYLAARKA
jgi:hypothetical protein